MNPITLQPIASSQLVKDRAYLLCFRYTEKDGTVREAWHTARWDNGRFWDNGGHAFPDNATGVYELPVAPPPLELRQLEWIAGRQRKGWITITNDNAAHPGEWVVNVSNRSYHDPHLSVALNAVMKVWA